jgi:hypothetical protein
MILVVEVRSALHHVLHDLTSERATQLHVDHERRHQRHVGTARTDLVSVIRLPMTRRRACRRHPHCLIGRFKEHDLTKITASDDLPVDQTIVSPFLEELHLDDGFHGVAEKSVRDLRAGAVAGLLQVQVRTALVTASSYLVSGS